MKRLSAVLGLVFAACPARGPELLDASVAGNACESTLALALPSDGSELAVTGDTTGFADHAVCVNQRTGAEGGRGPDVIYRFTTPEPVAVQASIEGGTLHLGSASCEVNCANFSSLTAPGHPVPFDRQELLVKVPAGESTLIAEAAGPYVLHARRRPVLAGDDCAAPLMAALDAGAFVLERDLGEYFVETSNTSLDCPGLECAADLFLGVSVAVPSAMRVVASTDAGIELRVEEAACASAAAGGSARPSYSSAELSPGTHAVSVTGKSNGRVRGAVSLRLELEVWPLPPGDSCDQPLQLAFAADGGTEVASASGDTRLDVPSVPESRCAPGSNDVVLAFTLSAPRSLYAVVTTSTPTYRPALALRAGRCTASDAACDAAQVAGAGAQVTATALPAGAYFLWLGGVGRSSGSWSLEVRLTP